MKVQSILVAALVLSVALWVGPARADFSMTEFVALHFHPETATKARQRSLALAAWLEDGSAEPEHWKSRVEAHMLTLERRAERVNPEWAPAADGMFAWLVHARDHNMPATSPSAMMPTLHRVSDLLQLEEAAGRLARLYPEASYQSPRLWLSLHERLVDADHNMASESADGTQARTSPAAQILEFWQPLIARYIETDEDASRAHALRQADRVMALIEIDDADRRQLVISELLLEQAKFSESNDRIMPAVWLLMEGLIRLSGASPDRDLVGQYQAFLEAMAESDARRWRRIDADLPVVLALLQDATAYLAGDEPAPLAAMSELADAYARLALFAGDAAFYLDQPVREDMRRAISQCNPDPLLVGPLPREMFESCLALLTGLLTDELDREELTGDGSGPFADEFLRREMGLVSWQRASYLDGHLNWYLRASCEPVQWINVLEWSVLMQYLVYWVPQRPVFFGTARWQNAVEAIADVGRQMERDRGAWIDCMTGLGSARTDPVLRMLDRHERAQANLAGAVREAVNQFYESVTRSGADIDLDAGTDQVTAYRPEGLMIGPCEDAPTCGARTELPASRALLGLFPNAYLLADQIGLGQVRICYQNVRWVDREQRKGRGTDDRVANYHGRLSFELTGTFVSNEEEELVFRQRLTSGEHRHYLFAAADETILELDCPTVMAGEPVASHLPEGRLGLVPDRLTYFVSMPTTAEAQLTANWDRGSEWRDWFVTGSQVESLHEGDGGSEDLALAVRSRLSELTTRRERQLSSSLLSLPRPETTDPLVRAMTQISDNTTLTRRVIELHYPRLLRHNDDIRALLSGDGGLLTRERVRQMRDAGVPMARVPFHGRERMESMREQWRALPSLMRESGHPAPEYDYGQEKLDSLFWLSRAWPTAFESSPDRQSTD